MVEPELNNTLEAIEPTAAAAGTTKAASEGQDYVASSGSPNKSMEYALSNGAIASCQPPAYFNEALEDAERMLKHAAEIGIDVENSVRHDILSARAASSAGWNDDTAARLLVALTKLAARLKPVTAESLKACSETRLKSRIHFYWIVPLFLVVILGLSLAGFLTSAISDDIRKNIETANDLAVKLRAQLGPSQPPGDSAGTAPPLSAGLKEIDVITELQQYASTIRSIDGRARQLNGFVLHLEPVPFPDARKDPNKIHDTFQLPVGLPNLRNAADDRTRVYQDVRYFAQNVLEDVSLFYGGITSFILPALYALLGTCAYLLRAFEKQVRARTFTPSVANYAARFLTAAIVGVVVGLFNNFTITPGASISPLAVAFLAGYAVDVFFAFLEGLMRTFAKSDTATGPSSTA